MADKRIGNRLRRPKLNNIGPVELDASNRTHERDALEGLWREMSQRRLLTDDGASEYMDAMAASAESLLIEHIGPARDALPSGSAVDVELEEVGDIVNRFRTAMQTLDFGQDYRLALRDLREDILAVVFKVNDLVPTPRGKRLAEKINPDSAMDGPWTIAAGP